MPKMDMYWKAHYPVISCGGKCVVLGSPDGTGNWFHKTYLNAIEGKNNFHVFKSEYTECPEYWSEPECRRIKDNLGDKYWRSEMLQEFVERDGP